ncbi:MAG: flagellar motor protein MotA [Xanthomonadales bacterium PRO7]|nr:flagellar motor protein MotA [Xanthomonadales bacterium PRO7]HMM56504.1 flagellar motor protein MotA [Rudaea sp.]
MTKPSQSLVWMLGFLAAVAVLAILLATKLIANFQANPFFNGVILAVLVFGIVVNFRQVLLLSREIEWIETFKRSPPDRPLPVKPRLLAPMARMFAGRERAKFSLSTQSLRSVLDSVYLRLEESRDLSRYLVGLAIFLGLLGTFWGLLVTIRSVADIIGSLGVGTDPAAMFTALKENLKEPLSGMSTSFSTSLFGLASSLVLGFLDLQAGHAQNRFYNELEDWLSSMTRLSSGALHGDGEASVPAYVQALLEQTADGLERMQRALVESERERHNSSEQLSELNTQLARLTDSLGRDRLSDELRGELRLLSRTIAAAVDGKRSEIN